jgi:hypothetical protein
MYLFSSPNAQQGRWLSSTIASVQQSPLEKRAELEEVPIDFDGSINRAGQFRTIWMA